MKFKPAKFVCMILSAMTLAIALLMTFAACNSYTFDAYDGEGYKAASSGAALPEQVTCVEIDWAAGNVEVGTDADAQNVTFSERSDKKISEDHTLHYLLKDGVLHLKFAKSGASNIDSKLSKSLVVTLPIGQKLSRVDIKTSSAHVNIHDVEVERQTVKTNSGRLAVTNRVNQQLNVNSQSGAIGVEVKCAIENVDVSSTSGAVSVYASASVMQLKAHTSASALDVNVLAGCMVLDADVSSVSGHIGMKVRGSVLAANISQQTGNVDLTIKKQLPFKLEFVGVLANSFVGSYGQLVKDGDAYIHGPASQGGTYSVVCQTGVLSIHGCD